MTTIPPLDVGREALSDPQPSGSNPVFPDWVQFRFRAVDDVCAELEGLAFVMVQHVAFSYDESARDFILRRREDTPARNFVTRFVWSLGSLDLLSVQVGSSSTREWSHVTISGRGCGLMKSTFWPVLCEWAESRGAELVRLDLAVDVDEGPSFDEVMEAATAGEFDRMGRARARSIRPICPDPRDASSGWTVYLGNRDSARCVRVYQKHAEVLAKEGARAAAAIPVGRVRVELECKRTDGYIVPWSALVAGSGVFAGDCEFLARVGGIGAVPLKFGASVRAKVERNVMQGLDHVARQYGAYLEKAVQHFLPQFKGDRRTAELFVMSLVTRGSWYHQPHGVEVEVKELESD